MPPSQAKPKTALLARAEASGYINAMKNGHAIGGVLLDLDGTVYRGKDAVPGASEFIQALAARDIPYLFVTNRANRTPEDIADQLVAMGIACGPEHVLTSALAAARFLGGGTAWCVGEPPLPMALQAVGITVTDQAPDAVVVGLDSTVTYKKLETATRLILAGARFVATNTDHLLSTHDGFSPGNGAIVAAIAKATSREPIVIGKPERPIIDGAIELIGVPREEIVVIGDNPETDILAAQRAGVRSALILTGVADRHAAEAHAPPPTWIVDDYDQLERAFFA